MNGLLTGLLARRETGLIKEIEKLERRITDMENQANEGMWIAGDDMQLAQYASDKNLITEYKKGILNNLPKEEILDSLVNGALRRIKFFDKFPHAKY